MNKEMYKNLWNAVFEINKKCPKYTCFGLYRCGSKVELMFNKYDKTLYTCFSSAIETYVATLKQKGALVVADHIGDQKLYKKFISLFPKCELDVQDSQELQK